MLVAIHCSSEICAYLRDDPSLIVHRGSYQANQGRAEPPDKLLHKLPAVHARLLDPTLAMLARLD